MSESSNTHLKRHLLVAFFHKDFLSRRIKATYILNMDHIQYTNSLSVSLSGTYAELLWPMSCTVYDTVYHMYYDLCTDKELDSDLNMANTTHASTSVMSLCPVNKKYSGRSKSEINEHFDILQVCSFMLLCFPASFVSYSTHITV